MVKGLPGLLTILHDGKFDDRECIAWLFTDDDCPARPIDALRENRGTEAKRRAQAMAHSPGRSMRLLRTGAAARSALARCAGRGRQVAEYARGRASSSVGLVERR